MRKNLIIAILSLCIGNLLFISCKNRSSAIQARVVETLKISSAGMGGDGKALWVMCTGHDKSTSIIVNGVDCKTLYYDNHMTCLLPKDFNTQDVNILLVELYNEKENVKSASFQINLKPTAGNITISSCGTSPDGKALWVKCNGHTKSSKILINNKICETVFYVDHLTCGIPDSIITLGTSYQIQVNNPENNSISEVFSLNASPVETKPTALSITNAGFGDNKSNAIWIMCTGHSKTTRIFVEGQELETVFYNDHVTGTLPSQLAGKKTITVKLQDESTKLSSGQYVIKR